MEIIDRLLIQPNVLEAPAVERAVHHDGHVLDIGSPAGRTPGIEDNRPRLVLGQFALDCPYQLLPALPVGLHRLLLDQLIDFRIAVVVPIEARSTSVVQIEDRIGVLSADLPAESDREILPQNFRHIGVGFDRVELSLDINLLQLVDQDDGRIPGTREITRQNLYFQPAIRPVTELLHDPAGLGAAPAYVGIVTRQTLQRLWRHAPEAVGRRLQHAADLALSLAEDMNE